MPTGTSKTGSGPTSSVPCFICASNENPLYCTGDYNGELSPGGGGSHSWLGIPPFISCEFFETTILIDCLSGSYRARLSALCEGAGGEVFYSEGVVVMNSCTPLSLSITFSDFPCCAGSFSIEVTE
jgi:hypothetical protein